MTPKEKAKKLFDDFYDTTPNEAWINEPLGLSKEYKAGKQAKQCALIAVDEILDVCKTYLSSYYLEVKKEIEKL